MPEFIAALRSLLDADRVKTVIELGAHLGQSTQALLQAFPNADIHCFEPNPETRAKLNQRFRAELRVYVYPEIVTDHCGVETLNCNLDPATDSIFNPHSEAKRWIEQQAQPMQRQRRIEGLSITIDQFMQSLSLDKLDLLFSDIQGAELRALSGAKQALERKAISVIFAELLYVPIYEGQANQEDVVGFLAKYGYKLRGRYNEAYDLQGTGQLMWADGVFTPGD